MFGFYVAQEIEEYIGWRQVLPPPIVWTPPKEMMPEELAKIESGWD